MAIRYAKKRPRFFVAAREGHMRMGDGNGDKKREPPNGWLGRSTVLQTGSPYVGRKVGTPITSLATLPAYVNAYNRMRMGLAFLAWVGQN